jgi:hypothetical protein
VSRFQKPIWNELANIGAIDHDAIPVFVDNPEVLGDDEELPPLEYDSDDDDQGHGGNNGDLDEVEIVEPRHGNWPTETHLIYPVRGGKIALGPQNLQIQRVARASIQGLMRSIYWDNAFPDHGKKTIATRDALYDAAKSLGFTTIAQRIKSDAAYVEVLAGLASPPLFILLLWTDFVFQPYPRIGLARLEIKKAAAASVKGHYELTSNAKASAEDISNLIANDTYIYPRNAQVCHSSCELPTTFIHIRLAFMIQTKRLENNRPYRHPIIVSIIKDQVFTGSHSIGVRQRSDFKSSLPDYEDEPELPAPMVALVATAVSPTRTDNSPTNAC